MVVRLDLLIPGKETADEGEKSYKHLAVFAVASLFFIASFIVLAVGGWKVYALRSERALLLEKSAAVSSKLDSVNISYTEAVASNQVYKDKLSFVLEDIPSIEFFSSLIAVIPDGVSVESVKMTKTDVALTGKAKGEEAVLALAGALASIACVDSASLPDIKPVAGTGGLFTYSVNLKLIPMPLLNAASHAATEIPAAVESGDAR